MLKKIKDLLKIQRSINQLSSIVFKNNATNYRIGKIRKSISSSLEAYRDALEKMKRDLQKDFWVFDGNELKYDDKKQPLYQEGKVETELNRTFFLKDEELQEIEEEIIDFKVDLKDFDQEVSGEILSDLSEFIIE